ncbi:MULTISPECIES: metal-sensitive transcriptional regulator [Paenibacillus]|uniref:Metal-sensitive transcriptional repressor n=1 Tax=Paenibacillus naphthalenovorans TaxID=162209 RepID=A0A0U2W9P7_9BACL|nr:MULTISPECIES: metal-sensitive transcriptional regulator [Paenibacillus]ALS25236.1 metal-sensitive transcriptional repressor [Paenibacillus naphthalenovorans]NTZ20143.1 metal-sensitive transcriptional regulator [Paenibacillus sp. JMULE4]GCL73346.1 cytoplasmic protein [Paenibacillus naphthalenovorans]SDI31793.1 DNA-binding transcriptional regulator, FrmR family [Paenibacillus naphthalenovorans]
MNYDDDIKRRLRRVEGQVRGVLKMIEEEKNCKDVVSQLSAVRSAVDKAMAYIVAVNLEQCILEEKESGRDTGKLVQEAVELLIKSR